MNCLEFRRHKLADPRASGEAAMEHIDACPHCRAFAHEIDMMDQQLLAAVSKPVPEGLGERILLKRQSPSHNVRRWALAACLVIAVGTGISNMVNRSPADFAQLAIEHVIHEPQALAVSGNGDSAFFEKVLADFGGRIQAPLGRVRHISLCTEREGAGWHVVLETEQGLVTLMLIPGDQVKKGATASSKGWYALVEPGGKGHYAIVTQDPQQTNEVNELFRQRVQWNANALTAGLDKQKYL